MENKKKKEIEAIIPSSQPVDGSVRQLSDNIKISLAELDNIISQRIAILAQVTSLNESADISNLLIQSPNPEFIVQQELSKFHPLQEALNSNCQSQATLLNKIAVIPPFPSPSFASSLPSLPSLPLPSLLPRPTFSNFFLKH